MRVRMATRTDVMAMVEIERGSPTATNWSHKHYESLLRMEAPAASGYFVVVVENESADADSRLPIVAYLAAHHVDEEWELQYMVVAPEFQRQGVGTYALKEFIEQVRKRGGARIFLEVRESNRAARALYRKLGFEETGLRKSYYSNPPEDAIICRLTL